MHRSCAIIGIYEASFSLHSKAMDHENRLQPSSPSLHAVEAHTPDGKVVPPTVHLDEEEKRPLLGGGEQVKVVAGWKRLDLRSLTLVTILWITTLFIGAAYSLIAPFFPEEV